VLTTHFHLTSRVRVRGAVPLFSLSTFMAWTGTTLPFLPVNVVCQLLQVIDGRLYELNLLLRRGQILHVKRGHGHIFKIYLQ
jgi:hypothetical protein